VVQTQTCVSILVMFVARKCSRFRFLSLFKRQNMRNGYTVGGKRMWYYILCLWKTYCMACNSVFPVCHFDWCFTCSLYSFVQDLVFAVVRIHNAVWVRTPCSLIHGCECFGGACCICLHRHPEDGGSMSWPNPQYPPVRLQSPITQQTIILYLNILHFPCIIWL
jgi:hypothetical protein